MEVESTRFRLFAGKDDKEFQQACKPEDHGL